MDVDDDSDVRARSVKTLLEDVTKEVMRSHVWNCLKTRAVLAANTTGPDFGWDNSYTLPTECVRLVTVNGYDASFVQDWYEVESRDILTDATECKITYISYSEDTTKYDPLLLQATVVLLASRLASKIGKDDGLSQSLLEEYRRVALPLAQKVDGNEQKRRPFYGPAHSRWVAARYIPTNV